MSEQMGPKKGSYGRDRSRAAVKNCPNVDEPQGVQCHRMPGLQAMPITPAKHQRMGRPGKGSLLKRDCLRERKKGAKVLPNDLSQGAGKKKVPHGLDCPWAAEMTMFIPAEVTHPITEWQGIE